MAGKGGSRAAKKAPPASGGPGHNSGQQSAADVLNDDQRHFLTLQHKKTIVAATAAKKKADADFKNAFKAAKADLGKEGVDDVKDMIAADNDEHYERKVQAELERKARLARWLGLELGAQGKLFGDGVPESQFDRGFAAGKRAGLNGEVCKPDYSAGTEGYDGYMKGWHEGQAVLAAKIKPMPDSGLIRGEQNKPGEPDDFDTGGEETRPWPDDKQVAGNKPAAEEEKAPETEPA